MADHAALAKKYRLQAEGFRGRAGLEADAKTREQYVMIAGGYEAMANSADKMAASLETLVRVRKSSP